MKKARESKESVSIGFLGNVVSLWEALAEEKELLVDLGSDQTSLHNPYNGGYYPVQLNFEEAKAMMSSDPDKFKELVQTSLVRHVAAVNKLTARGGYMHAWMYGCMDVCVWVYVCSYVCTYISVVPPSLDCVGILVLTLGSVYLIIIL
jgi:urocanate hydratase